MFRKELSYYFSTPIAYIVIGLYLLAVSLFLWVIPGQWNIIDSGYAQTDGLFQLSPWLLMFLCPALTMRLFAEERQNGTWDMLLVQPVSMTRIVLGKFFAAWTLMLIALLPNVVHYFIVYTIAEPVGNIDGGQFAGSFIGLIMMSGTFIAIGMLAGSFTKSQIVAYVTGMLSVFVLYWVLLQDHYSAVSRGVIDFVDVLVFAGVAILCLAMTVVILKKISRV